MSTDPREFEHPIDGTGGNVLDLIQARAEAASEGPWKLWGMTVMADPLGNSNVEESHDIAYTFDPDRGLRTFNATFIAHAREDVPKLVAALRAVEALCVDPEHHETQGPHNGYVSVDNLHTTIWEALNG